MPDNTSDKTDRYRLGWHGHGKAAATIASHLSFEGLERRYGEYFALAGVTFDVAPGEIVGLLGSSGSGKTTLLRVASGIEKPSGGRVLLDNIEIAGPERFVPPERRNIGLMFQDFALFPHLSVLDNVRFGLHALAPAEARREAMTALERVGLSSYADNYPHILSGGQQQRVALARAIAPRPAVLLMDEPFSGLDVRLREYMREETRTILREMRSTCIIVTHDPQEAMRLSDRIGVMEQGWLLQIGTAEQLYDTPDDLRIARFFSDVNELPCVVRNGCVELSVLKHQVPAFADGEDVVICVRQQGVRLLAAGEGVAGRVLQVRFLGDEAVIEVAVEGLDQTLRANVRNWEAVERGSEVGVAVTPSSILVFPRDRRKST